MSGWRYFWIGEDEHTEMVYRWRANGKALRHQEREDIQVFGTNGKWLVTERAGILNVELNGWFREDTDEISEEEAQEFVRKGLGRYGHDAKKPA
jgi:hypothetical protein